MYCSFHKSKCSKGLLFKDAAAVVEGDCGGKNCEKVSQCRNGSTSLLQSYFVCVPVHRCHVCMFL